jgi:uracil permease
MAVHSQEAALKEGKKILGYMPEDTPPVGALLSLGFQQVLTMFPATVLVAILTKFDIGVTLFTSGLGTIIALLVSRRRIPLYYGSSFSYIAVIITVMATYAGGCFNDPLTTYCAEGVRIAQVGILGTAVLEILIGLGIIAIGKAALDKVLPPIITGSVAIVIGIALAGTAISEASGGAVGAPADFQAKFWIVSSLTLLATIVFSVYLQGRGLLGMLPILLGAIFGYLISIPFGLIQFGPVPAERLSYVKYFGDVAAAQFFRVPPITFPDFANPNAWAVVFSIALICIATIPESTAHLYQMSLYIDQLAKDLGRKPTAIKNLIGLNLVADGSDDLVAGLFGGSAGTNYGENNSLMAITRNYSVPVLMAAGVMAILLAFVGVLAALIGTVPIAVVGGLSIYLFGVIGMQGVALLQSERVNLFDPKNLAIGAVILVLGIGGNLSLANGLFPFKIPVIFPSGIPAIVFAAIVGIILNLIFVILPPSKFGVVERSNLE